MRSSPVRWCAAVLAAAAALAGPPRAAAQYTWTNPGNGSWNDPANWSPNGVPNAAGATATFGFAVGMPIFVTLASDVTVGTIAFDAITADGAYTIGSSNRTITLASATGSAGAQITMSNTVLATNPQVLNTFQTLRLADQGGLAITNNSATSLLRFSGPVVNATNAPIVVGGSGNVQFDQDTLSGAGALTVNGPGTLNIFTTLSGFTGKTTVTGGAVAIISPTALGPDPATFVADQLTLNGGAFRDASNVALTLGANRGVKIGAAGGTFDVSSATGTLQINGTISGNGPITKTGPGTFIPVNNVNYAGAVTVTGGGVTTQFPDGPRQQRGHIHYGRRRGGALVRGHH
jgi:hypothetical protein